MKQRVTDEESAHTPEPWKIANGRKSDLYMCWNTVIGKLDDGDKFVLAQTNHHYDASKANARRIVACVNSCAGITTKMLESFSVLHEINESRIRRENAEKDSINARAQLAIAVKALEKINERHSFADIVDDSYIISRDALKEIQG